MTFNIISNKLTLFIASALLASSAVHAESSYFLRADAKGVSPAVVVVPGIKIEDLDWIDTRDTCQGVRQSTQQSNLYFARSKSSVKDLTLTIPTGYHWASWSEIDQSGRIIALSYLHNCGLSGYPYSLIENKEQHGFWLSDSAENATYLHAGFYQNRAFTINERDHPGFAGLVLIKD